MTGPDEPEVVKIALKLDLSLSLTLIKSFILSSNMLSTILGIRLIEPKAWGLFTEPASKSSDSFHHEERSNFLA